MSTQQCSRCGEEKADDQFSWKNRERGKRQTICKACHQAYRRQHYLDNREKYVEKARRWNELNQGERRARLRKFVYNYLMAHPCVDCGETDPVVLEFDHVRGVKEANISYLIHADAGLARLKAEIAKCEVRCVNCHRRKTARERGYWLLDWAEDGE